MYFHAKTLTGLEEVLANELSNLGAEDVTSTNRLVSFRGDQAMMYRANLRCRTAIRILKPIHSFSVGDETELYDGVGQIDWAEHLDASGSLWIDPVVYNSFCTHSLYAAQLVKDSIVDQFRSRFGKRPSVDRTSPDLRINLYLNHNQATLYLDSSGASLHKRGYRQQVSPAPLNEALAAGLLLLSQWDRSSNFVDPMCGSGTLVIEAALLALNIAPGLFRSSFGYQKWKDYAPDLHAESVDEAREMIKNLMDFEIVASDVDPAALGIARQNAQAAGVDRNIRFECREMKELTPPKGPGMVMMNPPYDERLRVEEIGELYRTIGDTFKWKYAGYTAFLLTGNLEASKCVGLRTSQRIPLRNGSIECRLLRYEMYAPKAAEPPKRDGRKKVLIRPAMIIEEKWNYQAEIFENRLRRMGKHWKRWARRQGIGCYRIYDRDIPEIPLAIDYYEGFLHVAEYVRPHDRTPSQHASWMRFMLETAGRTLEVEPEKIFVKLRQRQRGRSQYGKQGTSRRFFEVSEGGFRFRVNFEDYLNTGLFLDHRITRSMIRDEAHGKIFLNLFGYTGSFGVYAAAGGALSTTTVDLSNTYLRWARENMALNKFSGQEHRFVRQEVFEFLKNGNRARRPEFDLAVVDAPTYSNSKRTIESFDVQQDHRRLFEAVLERMGPNGKIYFSTNHRKFRLDQKIPNADIREITSQTVPLDFRRKRPHRCWVLTKKDR